VSDIRVGISGWRYAPWRKEFYPAGLPQASELAFAARAVNSIEINGSFYSLQTPERYRAWHDQTPAGFVFALKGPRFITHMLRLGAIDQALANFFASGPLLLGDKLGPILWQLPPTMKFDETRLAGFLERLPANRQAAGDCATRCAEHLRGNAGLDIALEADAPLRHALEVRHESFLCERFVELLRQHGVALVVSDSAGKWPYVEDVTADFMYLRLHGDVELYSSGYTAKALRRWKTRILNWAAGSQPDDARLVAPRQIPPQRPRDVYCYFDNDQKVHAPFDARRLLEKLDAGHATLAEPGVAPGAAP